MTRSPASASRGSEDHGFQASSIGKASTPPIGEFSGAGNPSVFARREKTLGEAQAREHTRQAMALAQEPLPITSHLEVQAGMLAAEGSDSYSRMKAKAIRQIGRKGGKKPSGFETLPPGSSKIGSENIGARGRGPDLEQKTNLVEHGMKPLGSAGREATRLPNILQPKSREGRITPVFQGAHELVAHGLGMEGRTTARQVRQEIGRRQTAEFATSRGGSQNVHDPQFVADAAASIRQRSALDEAKRKVREGSGRAARAEQILKTGRLPSRLSLTDRGQQALASPRYGATEYEDYTPIPSSRGSEDVKEGISEESEERRQSSVAAGRESLTSERSTVEVATRGPGTGRLGQTAEEAAQAKHESAMRRLATPEGLAKAQAAHAKARKKAKTDPGAVGKPVVGRDAEGNPILAKGSIRRSRGGSQPKGLSAAPKPQVQTEVEKRAQAALGQAMARGDEAARRKTERQSAIEASLEGVPQRVTREGKKIISRTEIPVYTPRQMSSGQTGWTHAEDRPKTPKPARESAGGKQLPAEPGAGYSRPAAAARRVDAKQVKAPDNSPISKGNYKPVAGQAPTAVKPSQAPVSTAPAPLSEEELQRWARDRKEASAAVQRARERRAKRGAV
jgi:hypothetical protein